MNFDECLDEIENLEAKLLRFRPRTPEEVKFWDKKRAGIFESVRHFDADVVRQAFQAIVEDAEDDEKVYFPTVPEILRACHDASKPPSRCEFIARFEPADHTCSKLAPERNEAFEMFGNLFKYEAKHILCPADVPATCPVCGKQRIVLGIFDAVVGMFPSEMTQSWTLNFKGIIPCEEHEEARRGAGK